MKKVFLILIISVFGFALPIFAAKPTQQQQDDYSAVMLYLKSLSIATETYALEHKNVYPTQISDLTSGKRPYLQEGYCGQTIGGYTYYCVFSPTGYTFTADPQSESPDYPAVTIKTDVIIEGQQSVERTIAGKDPQSPAGEVSNLKDVLVTDELDKYKDLVAKDPKNYKDRLILANLYAGRGEGRSAAFHAEQVIALNPDEESLRYAYHTAIQGYYLDGDLKKSSEMILKLLALYPTDDTALSFQKSLGGLMEVEKYREQMEKRVNFAEFISDKETDPKPSPPPPPAESSNPKETIPVTPDLLEKAGSPVIDITDTLIESIGAVSTRPGEQDFIILNSGKIMFTGPPGWLKVANVRTIHGDSLLFYSKFEDKNLPAIAINVDTPDADIKSAMDYSLRVKEKTQVQFPQYTFAEPKEEEVNGFRCSYNDMTVKDNPIRSIWYQFLINEKIITVQYMNMAQDFSADYPDFQSLVDSMQVNMKYKRTIQP